MKNLRLKTTLLRSFIASVRLSAPSRRGLFEQVSIWWFNYSRKCNWVHFGTYQVILRPANMHTCSKNTDFRSFSEFTPAFSHISYNKLLPNLAKEVNEIVLFPTNFATPKKRQTAHFFAKIFTKNFPKPYCYQQRNNNCAIPYNFHRQQYIQFNCLWKINISCIRAGNNLQYMYIYIYRNMFVALEIPGQWQKWALQRNLAFSFRDVTNFLLQIHNSYCSLKFVLIYHSAWEV